MSHENHSDHTGLWIGVAVGGLVLGASLLWLKTRKKDGFKNRIADAYDDYKDRVVSFANEVKDSTVADWIQRAKQMISIFQRYAALITSSKGRHLRQGLLVGGLIGGAVALGTAIIGRRVSAGNEGGLIDRIVKEANCWKSRIATVIDALEEADHQVHRHNGAHAHNGTHPHSSTLDDVLQLATTGIQFWNKIKGH